MRKSVLCLVVLSALALLPAAAQAAAPRTTVARCDGARVDKAAGVARTLSDCGRVDLARGAEGAARQALGRFAGALGVRRDTRDLRVMRVARTSAGPRVRFQQFVKGVAVRNGQVAVALTADGSVSHVANGGVATTALDTNARVRRGEALLTARRRVPSGFDLRSAPTTKLVAEPTARGALTLAWLVILPTRAPLGDWNVIVSARSGEVLTAYNAIKQVNGSALTYAPNPVQQTGNTGLRDGAGPGDVNTPALAAARVPVALTDLSPGTNLLRGTYVDTTTADPVIGDCDLPYVPGQGSNAARTYNFTRDQDAFEEAAAYAAITRVQYSYIDLGFPGIFDHPLALDVHCTSDDNSFYSSEDGRLHMGDGGVDDAEDADVTVHEFGHATQDAQVPGFGPGAGDTEQGAMGEGFGDFLATYTYLQDGDPAYQAGRRFCAMEWDATAYNPVVAGNRGSGCVRWTDGRDEDTGADIGTYRGAPTEVHSDGRYWSTMLTCVFNGIEPSLGTAQARNRMLTLVIAHNFDLVPTAANGAFADSIDALRAEDKVRFDGNEIALVNACGQQRLGIAPSDPTPPTVNGSLSPLVPDGANGWYRTPPTVNWSVVDPQGALLTKGCQNITLGIDTPGTTVTCIGISDGGATVKSLSFKKDQGPPSLAPRLSRRRPRIGQRVRAIPRASDPISGIAVQSCPKAKTSKGGRRFVNCSATDVAGNRTTRSLRYTVLLPTLKLSRAKVSFSGTVSFRVKAKAAVKLNIAARAGKLRFRATRKKLKRGKAKTVRLTPGAKARSALLRKLSSGKRVKVKVTFSSGSGTKRTRTLKVRR